MRNAFPSVLCAFTWKNAVTTEVAKSCTKIRIEFSNRHIDVNYLTFISDCVKGNDINEEKGSDGEGSFISVN